MKLGWLGIGFVMALTSCAAPPPKLTPHEMAQRWAVKLDFADGSCSGTMIGPHQILSATHCFIESKAKSIKIDGVDADIVSEMDDGSDHSIITVNQNFASWAKVAPLPEIGEPIFSFGCPGEMKQQFRVGYVAARDKADMAEAGITKKLNVTTFSLPIYFGDSGSGLFDAQGDLVAVVSALDWQGNGIVQYDEAAAFDLTFTPAQWQQVR